MLERMYYTGGELKHRGYRAGKEQRIVNMADELKANELYIAVLSVRSQRRDRREGLAMLSRVTEVTQHDSGLYGVEFILHDIMNRPRIMHASGEFEDGYLQNPDPVVFRPITETTRLDITGGYFKYYDPDHIESELQGILGTAAH